MREYFHRYAATVRNSADPAQQAEEDVKAVSQAMIMLEHEATN